MESIVEDYWRNYCDRHSCRTLTMVLWVGGFKEWADGWAEEWVGGV
jgi:hypothetical protein